MPHWVAGGWWTVWLPEFISSSRYIFSSSWSIFILLGYTQAFLLKPRILWIARWLVCILLYIIFHPVTIHSTYLFLKLSADTGKQSSSSLKSDLEVRERQIRNYTTILMLPPTLPFSFWPYCLKSPLISTADKLWFIIENQAQSLKLSILCRIRSFKCSCDYFTNDLHVCSLWANWRKGLFLTF